MTLTPIEVRQAGPAEGACPRCHQPIERGQRLALVRTADLGHAWVHLRHVIERDPASAGDGQ